MRPVFLVGIPMRWTRLPETPNAPGFGGAFVGTSGDLLLCGGGSNFPDKPAWEGGAKVWHDEVFSLASTRSKKWASLGKLPRPCGYGVGVSIRQGLLMIGGGVPKNFIQDTVVCAEILGHHDVEVHKYAVQITVADVRDGACSSSTLQEAASWGKVNTGIEQMVFAEAGSVMPLLCQPR